ncbi:phospholipase D-like domain-containing protein [Streptomyces sp. NPDC020403]|uniref:phospholipase D-like domain-containing protein n=1 Tax=unclassified Streptomyces TaxID=2593676 RepID=UPI0033FA8C79
MHAKLIGADRSIALLGSANLTDHAYVDNPEIGAVIHTPPLSPVSWTISHR